MEPDEPGEALTELRERRLGALGLLQAAAGSGLAAYAVWVLLLQPGFRAVPLRLQVLAAHRCGLRPALGYELNPWLVGLARLHAWRAGCAGSVRFCCQDLWKVNLRDCHNVSVFLAPSVLPLLEDKLQAELPEGARVVSGRFPLPTWQPVAVLGEGLDRVWAYDVHSGSPAGQVPPGPSSASVPGAPTSPAG
ncbi:adenine nucleotide translocase lysine N-methyltransferase isoform X2 [Vulpes vulpes]|uniref:Adenine nucleotide translocase lysine N-methyltransferase isoform X2 n=1 Tax=Vulpes vulpes TaxID=9627 RepID=A0A3Q7SFS7_VULVU|nr:protein N-lysine methyltransferase FAM173A isoform X2 [Vulpes vulpes]